VADRLHSAAIHLLRRLRKHDRLAGLSPARLSALSVLVFAGPVKLGDLAAAEQVSAPTMSRMVTGLEAAGLVTRRADAHDKRVTWVRATAKGERLLQEGRRRRVSRLARSMRGLEDDELGVLHRATAILERMLRELE
jgi:DNA-binding MarR family transcriptional regulator